MTDEQLYAIGSYWWHHHRDLWQQKMWRLIRVDTQGVWGNNFDKSGKLKREAFCNKATFKRDRMKTLLDQYPVVRE